jgi:hypothetical protein
MRKVLAGLGIGLLFAAGSAVAVTITTEQIVVPPVTTVEDQLVTISARGKLVTVTYQDTDVWPGTTLVDTDTAPDPVTVTVTGPTPPPPPSSAPSAPPNLHAENITSTGFNLVWDSSTDPDGISLYRVYRDGLLVGQGCGVHCGWANSWLFTGLLPGTQYRLEVEALDTLGNVGPRSSVLVTTLTPPATSGMANMWVVP